MVEGTSSHSQPYEGSLAFRWHFCLGLPSDLSLDRPHLISLLGSVECFLQAPLSSATYSLLSGLWVEFHHLDYDHAGHTSQRYRSDCESLLPSDAKVTKKS